MSNVDSRLDPVALVNSGARIRVYNFQGSLYTKGRVIAYCDQPTIVVEDDNGERVHCPIGMRRELAPAPAKLDDIYATGTPESDALVAETRALMASRRAQEPACSALCRDVETDRDRLMGILDAVQAVSAELRNATGNQVIYKEAAADRIDRALSTDPGSSRRAQEGTPTREDIRQASAALDEQLARTDEAQRRVDEALALSHRTPESEPNRPHAWAETAGLSIQVTACTRCGIVQRRDGQHGPCRGPVRVELRAQAVHDALVAAKPGDVFAFDQQPGQRVLIVVAAAGESQASEPAERLATTEPTVERPARSTRFQDAVHGPRDWLLFRAGSGRQHSGERSDKCPGDGIPGHRHDTSCIRPPSPPKPPAGRPPTFA